MRKPSWGWMLVVAFVCASRVGAQRPAAETATVDMLGEVEYPTVPAAKDLTVLSALFAGKPRPDAAWDHVVLVRAGGEQMLLLHIDVRDMMKTGKTTNNVQVRAGDILVVPDKARSAGASEQQVVAYAMAAVKGTGISGARRALVLGWLLENAPELRARQEAAVELGTLGAVAAPAVPSLVAALRGDPATAREAATALGMVGPAAAVALPALQQLARHGDAQLRERAKVADKQIRAAVAAAEKPPAK